MLMDRGKQEKYDKAYLKMASTWGQLSYCERKKVGSLIVKDRMIISDGYNGTPRVLKIFVKMKTIILNGMFYMPRLMLF